MRAHFVRTLLALAIMPFVVGAPCDGSECAADADCDGDDLCVDDECVECEDDADCEADERCDDGECERDTGEEGEGEEEEGEGEGEGEGGEGEAGEGEGEGEEGEGEEGEGEGVECLTRCDCSPGEVCDLGICTPPPPLCNGDEDCPRGTASCAQFQCDGFSGDCFDLGEGEGEAGEGEGEGGACIDRCDCSAGEVCSSGTCAPPSLGGFCLSDEDCPRGADQCATTACEGAPFGTCVAAECVVDGDCAVDERCAGGNCIADGTDPACEAFIGEATPVCDCGCGTPDPDCAGGGCTEPGCEVDGCEFCWTNGTDRDCGP